MAGKNPTPEPLVLAFDVFGTVVDWHSTIVTEMARLAPEVDGDKFALAWREGYFPAMARTMASGEWRLLDDLHMEILQNILPQFNLTLTDAEMDHLNQVWHRLAAWPDSVAALRRLKSKFILTTLSNGGTNLLVRMAKHAELPWDAVLCAETFNAYKPDKRTYQGVARIFEVPTDRVMMVATHHSDLDGAQDAGLRTAYIARPLELGATERKDSAKRERHPLHFGSLAELADHFGC